MIDYPDAIRDFLIEPSALFTLTSTRIWAEVVVPAAGYKPSDGGAIAFATRGGLPSYEGTLNPRVQFKCYGSTPQAANTVYRALYDRLHEAKSGAFKMALCDTLGQPLTEPDTGWYFVLTFYRFWF